MSTAIDERLIYAHNVFSKAIDSIRESQTKRIAL
jgi:hypothetical protein